MDKKKSEIEFYLFKGFVLMPLAVFLFFAVYFFVFRQAFDMYGLAMAAFLGIAAGSFLCKNRLAYWDSVIHGITSKLSGTVVAILLCAGIFSAMMKSAGIADGLIWFGSSTGITGAYFCVFTFIASIIIATTTGTSIGTIFASVPIFYTAGVHLGADPSMLAGAILSGAIFGDDLAPVSDVTVISAATQKFRRKQGVADIGGVVASRFKYAIAAAIIALPVYFFAGGGGEMLLSEQSGSPMGLIMLIPAILLVVIVILTRNIFTALIFGIITGSVIGILAGRFSYTAILSVSDGAINGFLYSGMVNMAGTIMLVLCMFGIVGIFEKSGSLNTMTEWLKNNRLASSPRGAELVMGFGALLSSLAFASVTSAALIMFGPIGDQIGAEKNIHPYRRSNIMSGMVNSLPVVMPFSAFVFITMAAVGGQGAEGAAVTPFTLFYSTAYPWGLFVVFLFCIITGAGRKFEGPHGEHMTEKQFSEAVGRE